MRAGQRGQAQDPRKLICLPRIGAAKCAATGTGKALAGSPKPFTRRTNKATSPFTRRTTSAVSAANECEGITCLWQVTRNGSDEAERSERSPPPGVARNAGVEGVGRRRRTSKRRSRAREWKCFATRLAPATGEGVRGTCATSPGAIRRPEVRCSLPSGHLACSCSQKLLPSGLLCLFLTHCKAEYKTDARLGVRRFISALQGCRAAFPGFVPTDWYGKHGSSKVAADTLRRRSKRAEV